MRSLVQDVRFNRWHETIRLYAAQNEATNLIRAVLANPTVASLTIAYDCLAEDNWVEPGVRQQLEAKLESDLESQDLEISKLAAQVQLSRRLKNSAAFLDDHLEIDLSYITCAEYQLFIDEKRQAGENRQPDHWKDYRFPPGDARKPITGVRASDAEEFCEWLTQKNFAPRFHYRLPTLAEAEKCPVIEQQIGCWCNDQEEKVIAGIKATQWQDWHSNLAEVTIENSELNINLNHDLNSNLNIDLNPNLNPKLNPDLKRILNIDLYRVLNSVLNLNFYRNRYPNLDLDLYRDLYHDLNYLLYRVLDSNLYPNFNPNFYRVLKRDFYRIRNRVRNRDLNRDFYCDYYYVVNRNFYRDLNRNFYRNLYKRVIAKEASNFLILYFPLLFFHLIYHVLFVTYKAISKNGEVQKQINISRQESEAISRKYQEKIDEIYPLYFYLVLLDERQAGRIPAWEGIRLVRERVD